MEAYEASIRQLKEALIKNIIFTDSTCIGNASYVKNVVGKGMESYEGCVCMNNGIVAYIQNGNYWISPGGYRVYKKLIEHGFKEASFMVICSTGGKDWYNQLLNEYLSNHTV